MNFSLKIVDVTRVLSNTWCSSIISFVAPTLMMEDVFGVW